MNLRILRNRFLPTHTVGQLYVEDQFFCFSLEDVVREKPGKKVESWKIEGETAIPTGTYKIALQDSPKFGVDTITIENVPGFKYIRIHSGNSSNDTEGCPILGYKLTKENLIAYGSTKPAVQDLKTQVKKALAKGEEVWITVSGLIV